MTFGPKGGKAKGGKGKGGWHPGAVSGGVSGGLSGGAGGGFQGACNICQEWGHRAANCPWKN
eukprot:4755922-Lingulodinium_polyedra.AAC.1